ncbi:hypothetical protein ACMAY6_01240 [Luminiphilus sp. nBUS_16]|uniref:hypothetical protein n=1 Tax=Luminiphilus sp. nBUS_16 TaxID=3395315 RepID=UPI003EBD9256
MGDTPRGAVVSAALFMANARSTRSKDPRCLLLRGHGFSVLCAWVLVGLFGCESSTSEPTVELKPTDRAYLEALVAEQILTLPSKIDKYTELTGVSAIPSGLRYKLRMIHMPAHTVDHGTLKTTRVNITQKSCSDAKERFELEAGVARHYVVYGMEDLPAGRFFVSDAACRSQ